MKTIRQFFRFIFILAIVGSIMFLLSINGENAHQINCKQLNIKCEPGKIHVLREEGQEWLEKTYEEAKSRWQKWRAKNATPKPEQ